MGLRLGLPDNIAFRKCLGFEQVFVKRENVLGVKVLQLEIIVNACASVNEFLASYNATALNITRTKRHSIPNTKIIFLFLLKCCPYIIIFIQGNRCSVTSRFFFYLKVKYRVLFSESYLCLRTVLAKYV